MAPIRGPEGDVISGQPAAEHREIRGPPVAQLGHWASWPNVMKVRWPPYPPGEPAVADVPQNDRDAT